MDIIISLAAPVYWFIMAPYKSPSFGSCAVYIHNSVVMHFNQSVQDLPTSIFNNPATWSV